MRTFFLPITLLFLLSACFEQNGKIPANTIKINATADSSNEVNYEMPIITFADTMHHFGKLIAGEEVTYGFTFTNTGNAPLLIAGASASCGCTVPEYPKDVINVGELGVIKVKFDSKGKSGMFEKYITVLSNTQPKETILTITGEIIEK